MPGALDFELTLSNGAIEVEQLFVFSTEDGRYIYSRNAGVGADTKDIRMAMDFESPIGSSAEWLNEGKYVARRILDERAQSLTVRVYDVSGVTMPTAEANFVRIAKPADAPSHPGTIARAAQARSREKNSSSNPSD
jgi:hypothetical protein